MLSLHEADDFEYCQMMLTDEEIAATGLINDIEAHADEAFLIEDSLAYALEALGHPIVHLKFFALRVLEKPGPAAAPAVPSLVGMLRRKENNYILSASCRVLG